MVFELMLPNLESWRVSRRFWLVLALMPALVGACASNSKPGPAAGTGGAAQGGGSSPAQGGALITSGGTATQSNGGTGTPAQGGSVITSGGVTQTAGSGAGGGSGGMPATGGKGTVADGGKSGNPSGGAAGTNAGTGGTAGAPFGGGAGSAGSPATGGVGGGTASWTPAFETKTLSTQHYAEGADVGDINGDGVLDLVAGPNWYAGPNFELGGKIADAPAVPTDEYSEFFLIFVDDLNADQRPDVIAIADAGDNPNARWYENPGSAGLGKAWSSHPLFNTVSNESPIYADLTGDTKKELVFMTSKQLGYAIPASSPTAAWTFKAISSSSFSTPYVHGLGVGDVDGDGVMDVVERSGWWRQVPGAAGASTWEQHMVDFAAGVSKTGIYGGSQMQVFDVDGDGDNDVVTALNAHGYGLSWFEQKKSGTEITFTPHEILATSKSGMSFSQIHATAVADMNGDGLLDLITGKRYYAHTYDPGAEDPAVIYWFELGRAANGATFTPRAIHQNSGVGCVFAVRDVNGDKKPDVFTSSKKGAFVHLQR